MRLKPALAATLGATIGVAAVTATHLSSSTPASTRPTSSSSTTTGRPGDAITLDGLNAAVLWQTAAWYAAAPTTTTSTRPSAPTPARRTYPSSSSSRCGGTLPPCYVMQRESGGSLTAKNPSSSASGKWQFLDSTWNGYGGYAHASDAPESIQDQRAAQLWNAGSGCSHWSAC